MKNRAQLAREADKIQAAAFRLVSWHFAVCGGDDDPREFVHRWKMISFHAVNAYDLEDFKRRSAGLGGGAKPST